MDRLDTPGQLLTGIIDSIEDGAAIFDRDDRLVQFNENYKECFLLIRDILEPGISFKEMFQALASRGLYDGPESGAEAWVAQRVKLFSDGTRGNEFQRLDGSWVCVDYYKLRTGGTFVVTADITRRVRLEKTLRSSERRHRAIAGVAPVGIFHTDANGDVIFVNEKWCQLGGMTSEAAMGKGWIKALHPDDREKVGSDWYQSAKSEKRFENEYRYVDADGATTWCYVQSIPEFDEAGMIVGYVGALTDITARKHMEEELRSSQIRLADALESIPDGFVLYDSDDRLVLCNERYRTIYPKHADKLIAGERFEDMLRAGVYRGEFAEAIGREEEWIGERLRIHADPRGPIEQRLSDGRWLRVEEKRTRDGGTVGLRTDITEFKRTEQALKENEERFRNYAEAAADWFWEMDGDLRFTYMSENVEWIVGVPPEWHYGKTREELLGDDYDREAWTEHLKTLQEHKPFRNFEYLRTGDGIEPKWLRTNGIPLFAEDGAFTGYRGTGSDITERKRIEDSLSRSEARLAAILDLAGEAIISMDDNRCVELFNEGAQAIFGYSAGEMIGQPIEKLMPERLRATHAGHLDTFAIGSAVSRSMNQRAEVIGLRRNGEEFPAVASISKIDLEDRTVFTVILHDITGRKVIEDQLRQAQKMEAVGQLTGGVAHDFNNLLAVILGNAELLSIEAEERAPEIEAVIRAAKRGAELTQRLLAFSRKQTLQPQAIELHALIGGMQDLLARTLRETIEIKTSTAPGLWRANADPGQLENALLNLAINARDAMPEGGTLMIEANNVSLNEAYTRDHADLTAGDYVMLAVSDSGQGMAPEVLEHAFEPFFTTKEVGQGSGLGLAMIYGFAKQSGGHVAIYSELGHGTTVKLYLPRTGEEAARASEERVAEVPRAKGETVLVVEDDADVRVLTIAMLEGLGYRVLQTPDGPAALVMLGDGSPPDLLLSDVVLPSGLSGPDLAEKARNLHPNIKVLFMSGYAEYAARHNSLAGIGAELLNKPFRLRELALKVRGALDR